MRDLEFVPNLHHALRGFWRDNNYGKIPSPQSFWSNLNIALKRATWSRVLDVCQLVYRSLMESYGKERADDFNTELNNVFYEAGVIWRMDEDRFERRHDSITEESLKAVFSVLIGPEFHGPDEQFGHAITALNARPEPNLRGCVSDAVGALEGVANIIAGTEGEQLNDLLKQSLYKTQIHGALLRVLDSLYGYRGNASAHGQVGESQVGFEEAEWVLRLCASTIVYLAKKFQHAETNR